MFKISKNIIIILFILLSTFSTIDASSNNLSIVNRNKRSIDDFDLIFSILINKLRANIQKYHLFPIISFVIILVLSKYLMPHIFKNNSGVCLVFTGIILFLLAEIPGLRDYFSD